MPVDDETERRAAISKAIENYRDTSATRTLDVEFRGEKKSLEVIRVNPSILLLNHNNSRLNAQLEDHSSRDLVQRNPTSVDAQDVLGELLRRTDKFKDLKNELKAFGQRNPGLISRDGLLINGNTRVVAIRDLGQDGIDVGVLPLDATSEDFLDIEMSLQMTRLTHQDYTFTNELLMMAKYLKAGHNSIQLAGKMGWVKDKVKKVEQSARILGTIEEVRALSSSHLPYSIFDSKKQLLKDLDEEYQRLKNSGDVPSAERMKWSRIAAMFLGINKDQVRVIDDSFFEDDVLKRADTKPAVLVALNGLKRVNTSDGLDEILATSGQLDERFDLRPLVKQFLNDPGVRDDSGGISADFGGVYADIAQAVRLATEDKITEAKFADYQAEPADILRETRLDLERILHKFPVVSSTPGFGFGNFEFELKKVKKATSELEELFKKYLAEKKP